MATSGYTNDLQHSISSQGGDIHDHMQLVSRDMKKTEGSFTERGYEFRWISIRTSTGVWEMGTENGFMTYLAYSVRLNEGNGMKLTDVQSVNKRHSKSPIKFETQS